MHLGVIKDLCSLSWGGRNRIDPIIQFKPLVLKLKLKKVVYLVKVDIGLHYTQRVLLKCLHFFFWVMQWNKHGQLMLCGQIFGQLIPDFGLWSDCCATLVQTFLQLMIRLQCDFALWSDRFATILQTMVRLKCFSDDVIRCNMGRTTPPLCDPNGLTRDV